MPRPLPARYRGDSFADDLAADGLNPYMTAAEMAAAFDEQDRNGPATAWTEPFHVPDEDEPRVDLSTAASGSYWDRVEGMDS